MTTATNQFMGMLQRNFEQGYDKGATYRRQQGEKDVAGFNIDDYAIPEQTPEGAPPAEEKQLSFGEGGDAAAVDALLEADAATGAIEESPTDFSQAPIDRAVKAQEKIPNVRVIDWEAAKAAKADAYARAGMADKAANIDQEFQQLKQQKFQNYASRALQVIDQDPAKAAELLTMASRFTADGKTSQFLPTPGGQLMEVEVDEMTGQPLGKGTAIDREAINKMVMLNADPQKFIMWQADRDYKNERARVADEQWEKSHNQRENQFLKKLDEQRKQWGHEMDFKYTELDQRRSLEEARNAAKLAEKTGYTQQQWDKKVESLNDYITAMNDPMKFRNEFGENYKHQIDDDGNMVPPDMLELRTGAEKIMSANGHNRNMSPQVATELHLLMKNPEADKSRFDTDKKTGQPIVKGADNSWYYLPQQGTAVPTPTG